VSCLMAIIQELLHLDKLNLAQYKSKNNVSFIWIIILFDEVLKYSGGAKVLRLYGTNAEPLSVQFCSFVQCHILVSRQHH
jgi:hypothetical protein